MLAFSTCWNSHRHTDGEEMVREILELGFDTIELSHGLKVSLLPGAIAMAERGDVKVSGLHNPCPSPVEVRIDAPDVYEFTSYRQADRTRGNKMAIKTIENTAKWGGKYIVLHLGTVPVKPFTSDLEAMVKDGKIHSREYVAAKHKALRAREKHAPLPLKRAIDTVTRLSEHAKEHKVFLAIESRSHFEQMPNEREMVQIQEHFKDDPWVGYWHDFGHVQRKANLDLLDHDEWLGRMEPYLVGGHLHDVQWPHRDHRVPFQGSIKYDGLVPFFPKEKPLVWELSPRRKTEDVRDAFARWKSTYPETL